MTRFANHSAERGLGASLRAWGMMSLTLTFVLLYGAALLGWVNPITGDKLIGRLEPLIFVILGYYFGRLPADQNESLFRDEINRQTQRADAAQHAKEQGEQAREALEEKLKNVRALLSSSTHSQRKEPADGLREGYREEGIRQSLVSAIDILNS